MKRIDMEKYAWACGELREAIDRGIHGNVTFSLKEGDIMNAKTEVFSKPPVDNANH